MVVGETCSMDWQSLTSPKSISGDKVSYIPLRLHKNLQRYQDSSSQEEQVYCLEEWNPLLKIKLEYQLKDQAGISAQKSDSCNLISTNFEGQSLCG